MMSSGPVAAAATAAAANAGRTTFWQTTSRATTAQDVISKHSQAGADDRNMRITVRRDYKQHGFTSNLFPVKIDPNRTIFQYRLDVDRVPREFVIPFHQQQQQQGNPDDQQNQQQLHQQMMNLPPSASSPLPPVSPTRAWRLYSQALRSSSRPLPPLLRVGSSIFSAGALPDEALTLGSEYHDKGWKKCELKLIASAPFSRLCPGDLKQVMNKMLPWALAFHARSAGASNTFNMVREIDGKMISTEDSLAVSGLRIFRGTTAAMLQIHDPSSSSSSSGGLGGDELGNGSNGLILPNSSNNNNNNAFLQHLLRHTGSTLSSLNPSHERCTTVRVLVLSFTRTFHYNGKEVQVWALQDASGFGSLAIWDYDQKQSDVAIHQNNNNNNGRNFPPLAEGMIIDISNFSLRQVQGRFRRETTPISNFEIAGSPQTVLKKVEVPPFENINNNNHNNNGVSTASSSSSSSSSSTPMSISPRFKDSTTLALRLDTRCTVASEKSLLDEIKQHFGDVWPYTDDQKTRITRAVLGTPVVLSINLKHSIVRAVRFDFDSPESAPMDPHLRQLAPELQKFQPYAVVHDFSIVPLQVLHCCFDPKMRSWQQVTAPACSFFPHDRAQVLSKFRTALSQGLLQWGVTLLEQPLTSDQVTVMEKREVNPRSRQQQYQQRNTNNNNQNNRGTSPNNQNNFQPQQQKDLPTLISITNIRSKHTSNEEMQGNEKTCTSLARYFRTNHHSTVEGEAAALMHVRRAHCLEQQQQQQPNANNSNNNNNNQNFALRDPNSVAIFLTSERDTRAARWLASECLRRGILPYFMTGISNEKRLGLLNKQTQQNLQLKFAMNPFPSSLDLGAEVPSLQGRNILMVGIDTCHTNSITTGSCVGFVVAPGNNGNFCVPTFWQNEVRGQELEQVTRHFGLVVEEARRKVPGQILHEIVVFQDGNVYAELEAMERCIPAGSRLSFLCLHKRTHIRFTFNDRKQNRHASASKGTVVRALTPVNAGSASSLDPKNNIEQNISDENQYGVVPEFSDQHHQNQNQEQQQNNNNNNNTSHFQNPSAGSSSFFLQCHECFTSTARTVQFVVHRQSDTLPLPDLQKLTFALAHVGSPQSTKLPLPTRAAHRLSAQIERLVEASAPFRNVKIPEPLRNRCWFL